ncbi:hypothetical protein C7Y45_10905 [Brevibacillus brevis]|nr:hypothetical protein C7Y45_10905 [Lysinibacillus sp. SDF0063]
MKDRKKVNVKVDEGWRAFTERIQPLVQQKMPFANKPPRAANREPLGFRPYCRNVPACFALPSLCLP